MTFNKNFKNCENLLFDYKNMATFETYHLLTLPKKMIKIYI